MIRKRGVWYKHRRVLSQDEIKRMMSATKLPEHRVLLGLLTQTGQRLNILRALKLRHINVIDGYGFVHVGSCLLDREGKNVNKSKMPYTFIIGKDAMKLIDELDCSKSGNILPMVKSTVNRAIHRIAKNAKVDRVYPPDFRVFWKTQMRSQVEVDRYPIDCMLGHRLPYGVDLENYTDEILLAIYKQAENRLALF